MNPDWNTPPTRLTQPSENVSFLGQAAHHVPMDLTLLSPQPPVSAPASYHARFPLPQSNRWDIAPATTESFPTNGAQNRIPGEYPNPRHPVVQLQSGLVTRVSDFSESGIEQLRDYAANPRPLRHVQFGSEQCAPLNVGLADSYYRPSRTIQSQLDDASRRMNQRSLHEVQSHNTTASSFNPVHGSSQRVDHSDRRAELLASIAVSQSELERLAMLERGGPHSVGDQPLQIDVAQAVVNEQPLVQLWTPPLARQQHAPPTQVSHDAHLSTGSADGSVIGWDNPHDTEGGMQSRSKYDAMPSSGANVNSGSYNVRQNSPPRAPLFPHGLQSNTSEAHQLQNHIQQVQNSNADVFQHQSHGNQTNLAPPQAGFHHSLIPRQAPLVHMPQPHAHPMVQTEQPQAGGYYQPSAGGYYQPQVGGYHQPQQPIFVLPQQPKRYTQRDYPTLAKFSGAAEEWPAWISYYRATTEQYSIPPHENFERVKKALVVNSAAFKAVRNLLSLPHEVEQIIAILGQYFGQPRMIVEQLKSKAQQFPTVKEERIEVLIALAAEVKNMVALLDYCAEEAPVIEGTLLTTLSEKMTTNLRMQWAISPMYGRRLTDFSAWLNMYSAAALRIIKQPLQASAWGSEAEAKTTKNVYAIQAASTASNESVSTESSRKCRSCDSTEHQLSQCPKFKDLSIDERWKFVRACKVCFCCFKNGHGSDKCRLKSCEIDGCNRKHHEMLHSSPKVLSASHTDASDENILLKILPVKLRGPKGERQVLAMIDEGSTATCFDHELVQELGLVGFAEPFCMKWSDGTLRHEAKSIRTNIAIQPVGLAGDLKLYDLFGVRSVNNLDLGEQEVDVKGLQKRFSHLKRAYAVSYTADKPRILIGMPHYHLCHELALKRRHPNEPFAVKMKLGWAICGPMGGKSTTRELVARQNYHSRKVVNCSCIEMHEELRHFMTNEAFGVEVTNEPLESLSEKRAKDVFQSNTKYLSDQKRYVTSLLWAQDEVAFPPSRGMAVKRLECAERRARKVDGGIEAYTAKIEEYSQKGFIRKLSRDEADVVTSRTWYTPHSCVFNLNKNPPKPRWVLDLAAEVNDISLNKLLLKGPDIYVSIVAMLCQFREKKVAVTGDIQEMFLRIWLRPEDHESLRILWRNGENREPDVYQFQVVPFGSRSSPYLAQAVKNLNAERFREQSPAAVDAIVRNHYVDDLMKSFESTEEALLVLADVIRIHAEGGFHIRGFLSNAPPIMQRFNLEKFEEVEMLSIGDEKLMEKVLGMWWNIKDDTIRFKFKVNKVDASVLEFTRAPTRSELLSIVMSVYDPMGFIAHYVSYAKIILREVVKQSAEWEQPIQDGAWRQFQCWWTRLKNLEQASITRWYSANLSRPASIQMHVFADASVEVFAAVAYIRVEDQNGHVDINLIGAKTRVAPVKMLSIPRLELSAAVLASRWALKLIESHDLRFERVTFHIDSSTVLDWLACRDPRRYKQFVAFRIAEILHHFVLEQWRYVPSKLNVADDATKFEKVAEDVRDDRWFTGPEFLKLTEDKWPQRKLARKGTLDAEYEQQEEELKTVYLSVHRMVTEKYQLVDFKADATTAATTKWTKAVSIIGYVFRAVKNFKQRNSERWDRMPFLRAIERREAETYLLKKSQWQAFSEDIVALEKGRQVAARSEMRDLSPAMMNDGLVHMRTRLEYAESLPEAMKFPIILSRHDVITKMIAADMHERFHHQSHEAVAQELLSRFKIKAIRQLVKEVRKNCTECKRMHAKPMAPEMSPLPKCRVEPNVRPFTHTGVDAFGPYEVIVGRARQKRYGIVFTCMTSRAIFVELADDLSADAFIICLRNFVNRHGRALKMLYSDNGSNFKLAAKLLKREFTATLEDVAVGDELAQKGIDFRFNCPDNAHAGGVWEREVRSIKTVLDKMLKTNALRESTLRSFLIEAENVVNSQPLTYIPITNESAPALTPNALLYGYDERSAEFGRYKEDDIESATRRWQTTQAMAECFWRRWIREYLPEITRRTKWHHQVNPLKLGDLVLIVDLQAKKNDYKRGRIVGVKETRSGQNREFEVLTASGKVFTRPAVRLAKIDIIQEDGNRKNFGDNALAIITGPGVAKCDD